MALSQTHAREGEFLMIGRYKDSGEEIFTKITDLKSHPSVPEIAYRALSEIGRLGPERYEFIAMLKGLDSGTRVVLTGRMLNLYARTHWL